MMKRALFPNLLFLVFSLAIMASPIGGASLEGLSIQLPVAPLRQTKITSCGPAVLAMAYRYAFPLGETGERDILTYAEMQGWYTETKYPYTSPANMVKIIRHYTRDLSTGQAASAAQGLEILSVQLRQGHPVIIDALTLLDDPRSGAHYLLVTGISVAPDNKYAVTIHYNDPLTGKTKSAPYYGEGGLWDAWRRNGDPGGSGWWLVIHVAPAPEIAACLPTGCRFSMAELPSWPVAPLLPGFPSRWLWIQ
jgi:hypothetical protein